MTSRLLFICSTAVAALMGQSAYAQSTPPGCLPGSVFQAKYVPNNAITPIASFAGNTFNLTGLAPGKYKVEGKFSAQSSVLMMPGVGGAAPDSSVGSDGTLSGTVTCSGPHFTYTHTHPKPPVPTALLECLVVNIGTQCNWYTIFEPNYYPNTHQNSHHATNPASYTPAIPRCTQPAPSTAPATVAPYGHVSPRCMRKFTFVRAAGQNGYDAQLQNGTAVELFPPN